mgnify:CR=1 FL=1
MKLPRTRNTFCPTCKKHTEHKVLESKRKTRSTAHPLSYGGRTRLLARGRGPRYFGHGNQGKYSKPAGGRMYNRKQSKKVDLRYQCKICTKMHISGTSWRAKKVEFKTA